MSSNPRTSPEAPAVAPFRSRLARLLGPAALAAGVLAVAGCGSSGSPTGPSPGAPKAVGGGVGGPSKCDSAQIGKAVAGVGQSQGTTAKLDTSDGPGFRCSDGWAVAQALVGSPPDQTRQTMIFEAEGQFWIPKDEAQVCQQPSDVPLSLYDSACEPG